MGTSGKRPRWQAPVMPPDRLDLRHMEPAQACAALLAAMKCSSCLIVLGWRLAERNLDYPAVAFVRLCAVVAGWPHGSMLAAGGIEGVLYGTLLASGSGWRAVSRTSAWCGAATVLVAEKSEKKD